ncbi:unnamed protein product [Coregonus sp. 'balchen']|nr:unnamed protein product [Coregonus sp. 'balchen']
MSAHENNMRDRKRLLEQLNEMTQAAARMEKKENITKFTDVMEYDPDTSSCYIPGLWHGTPPMAPVNAGYSEAVYSFKKTLMQDFRIYQYPQRSIKDVQKDLLREASKKLAWGEKEIQDNLVKYFEKEDGHVNLVEKYKEDFVCSAKTLRRETENTVKNKLQGTVEIKEGMTELNIIKCSQTSTMEKKVENKTDYDDTYIKELLNNIDETLQQHKNVKVSEECEVSPKLHICGRAAREFQKMHYDFIELNDPRNCLEQSKSKYLTEFIDLFHNRDQCLKKAEEFSKLLQPAVQDYVTKMIGPDVVDEMKTGKGSEEYSTRTAFQFSILKQLLTDGEYEKYKGYIKHYEKFVKDWLFDQIVQQLSKDSCLEKLEKKHLAEIVKKITGAIRETTGINNLNDVKTFIKNICSALEEKLVLKDALDSILILNTADTKQFSDYLIEFVREMEQSLAATYDKGRDIKKRLKSLPYKPQDKMFTSLFGCGKQCPFCGVPCEAGGKDHAKHFTSIHRPQGLNGVKFIPTNKLVINICSSDVTSNLTFINTLTGEKGHPFKDYQKYYPDWIITGDSQH